MAARRRALPPVAGFRAWPSRSADRLAGRSGASWTASSGKAEKNSTSKGVPIQHLLFVYGREERIACSEAGCETGRPPQSMAHHEGVNPWTDYPRKGNFPAELSTSFGAKRTRLGRSLALFFLSRGGVHEAFSQPASVVARRDNQQPRRGDRSGDRGLSGAADRVEVFAVDDDFHHRSDLRREPRFLTEFVTQRRAERL